jgi:hypothetical protein
MEYEKSFLDFGLQELFPGAKYLGEFKNATIGSVVEHMFEYEKIIYVADCKGGTGLSRRDNVLDVLAETIEFDANRKKINFDTEHRFIIITTELPPKNGVSWNRLQLAKEYGLHEIYVWNSTATKNNVMDFFNG